MNLKSTMVCCVKALKVIVTALLHQSLTHMKLFWLYGAVMDIRYFSIYFFDFFILFTK